LQGRFEIISLSGSLQQSENNGDRSRTCTLNVTLAGSDGRVLGGGVAGTLTAASTVQVLLSNSIEFMSIVDFDCVYNILSILLGLLCIIGLLKL